MLLRMLGMLNRLIKVSARLPVALSGGSCLRAFREHHHVCSSYEGRIDNRCKTELKVFLRSIIFSARFNRIPQPVLLPHDFLN